MSTISLQTQTEIQIKVPGKAILIGEHSAVYGFPAVACSLPNIQLSLRAKYQKQFIEKQQVRECAQKQEQILAPTLLFTVGKKEFPLEPKVEQTFRDALSLAYSQCSISPSNFPIQELVIQSDIPLGGGLGGSAALSVALVRLMSQIAECDICNDECIARANALDSIFHGKASGIDVSTIVSNGIISFQHGKKYCEVPVGTSFWLVLVDSEERTSTSKMVALVAEKRALFTENVDFLLNQLGTLAQDFTQLLAIGNLSVMGSVLNEAHDILYQLGVSTPKIDNITMKLLKFGALGAKITGGGGGGMVLGLFRENPVHLMPHLVQLGPTFITQIPQKRV